MIMKIIIYRLILTNDFLKLSSATFPKESLVKIAMNPRFKTKIIRKNGNEILTKNKGTIIDEKEVATTQAKITNLRF